jgi:hypothetical protein
MLAGRLIICSRNWQHWSLKALWYQKHADVVPIQFLGVSVSSRTGSLTATILFLNRSERSPAGGYSIPFTCYRYFCPVNLIPQRLCLNEESHQVLLHQIMLNVSSAFKDLDRIVVEYLYIPWNHFQEGDMLDVLDTVEVWCEATILTCYETKKMVFVHYVGFSREFDEWISFDSHRLLPLQTKTYHPKLVDLRKKSLTFWTLKENQKTRKSKEGGNHYVKRDRFASLSIGKKKTKKAFQVK